MNRIFISYRSSDAKKDADRLCADLSRLYGADQVFFDKQDLRGGLSWRDAIMAALGKRPVVLVLLSPDLLGMPHPQGGRRIDQEDDPIRGELTTARTHGAVIVPLLTEGMVMPIAADIPEPLRFLKEAHALKLRTEDWNNDLDKLVADLRGHGIDPIAVPLPPVKRSLAQRAQRALMWIGATVVGLVVLGLLVDESEDGPEAGVAMPVNPTPVVPPAAPTSPPPPPPAIAHGIDISGIWWSVDPANRRLRVRLVLQGGSAQLQTDPMPVEWSATWQAYAQSVLSQGLVVRDVRFVGQGVLTEVMGLPRVEMPYQVVTGDGRGPLDSGSIVLQSSSTGQELVGELWSNGSQAASPLRLTR